MPEIPADIATMTWEEVGEAFENADAVMLPLGSIEQHSLHLPLSTDSLRADYLTAELVEAAPEYNLEFVRLPTFQYGYSEHHMNFDGTITLGAETYKHALIDIGESLAEHGVSRLVMVNFHGGNRQPMQLATDRLQRDAGLAVHPIHWVHFARDYLEEAFGTGWGHAGDHETSAVELYRDDLVKTDKKEPQDVGEWPQTARYTYFDDITRQGGLGDPTNADAAVMADIVDKATADILEAIRADIEQEW